MQGSRLEDLLRPREKVAPVPQGAPDGAPKSQRHSRENTKFLPVTYRAQFFYKRIIIICAPKSKGRKEGAGREKPVTP